MFSVGTDIIEISRIKKSMKNPKFLKFILGPQEYLRLKEKGFPPQSVAADFCAKESFSKALGIGLRGFGLKEVQVLKDKLGKPYLFLTGNALKISKEKDVEFSLSLSHTQQYATAVVIAFPREQSSR